MPYKNPFRGKEQALLLHVAEPFLRYILHIDVGADDVFYLIRVRILEGKGTSSHPEPFSVLGPETEHDGQNLAF